MSDNNGGLTRALSDYRALSFDCYGTLIDWEAGFASVLVPWAREHELDLDEEALLLAYADNEAAVLREAPQTLYPEAIAQAFVRTGRDLDTPVSAAWADRMRHSVPSWPAFSDSADALRRLAVHYDLIILSNVHREGFAASNEHLHGTFHTVITAEDVGAYKPADNHFEALLRTVDQQGWRPNDVLHVAQSLFHDHVPARKHGLDSVWINRRHDRPGWGATPEPGEAWSYGLEFESMEALADAADDAFAVRDASSR